jgi:Tol biopolymer transport system component
VEIPLDGSGIRSLTETPVSEKAPAYSPSGSQFALVSDITGFDVIWVQSKAEGWQRPLVTEKDFPDHRTLSFSRPFFSPDGQRIVYHRNVKEGGSEIWISSVTGGSPVRLFADTDRMQFAPTWSPDGNSIAFITGNKIGMQLAVARIGSSSPPAILKEKVHYFQPQWSPDGKWLCYMTPEGAALISVDGKVDRPLSRQQWLTGGWSKDGATLYAIRQSEKRRLLISATNVATGEETVISDAGVSPLLITDAVFAGFTLAPDGQSFATSILRSKSDIWILEDFDPKPHSLFWFLQPKHKDGKEKAAR